MDMDLGEYRDMGFMDHNANTYSDQSSDDILSYIPPSPSNTSTRNMSKSARNRFYAQTSRARHRAYVSNLEKNYEQMMKRLEKMEEENCRMKEEIYELKTTTTASISKSSPTIISAPPVPQNHNLSVDTQYALSVLDLPHHDSNFLKKKNQPPSATNSPWPQTNLVTRLPLLVGVFEGFGRRGPMNWKGNYCKLRQRLMKIAGNKRNEMATLGALMKCSNTKMTTHMRNVLLLKLRGLRVYLQQSGSTIRDK